MHTPSFTRPRLFAYASCLLVSASLIGCYGDPMISGVDPYAPTVFKEGNTSMPLVPPNPKTLLPFYVSQTTIFKFAIDTQSILIGNDGVTRYMVQITSPSGSKQTQYEGIRCDSYQARLYGTYESQLQLARKSPRRLVCDQRQYPESLSSRSSAGRAL
jgi:hypothetical protein